MLEQREPSEHLASTWVTLSALQHYTFCPRQAALIHVEQLWKENAATVSGRILHERVDKPGSENRKKVRVVRSVYLRSEKHLLYGIADVVEYQKEKNFNTWQPCPVEYKRGRAKHQLADQVQLCAQALCLEEMHQTTINYGVIFYGQSHKRYPVEMTSSLRQQTENVIYEMRALIEQNRTPPPSYSAKCNHCSLSELCQPQSLKHDHLHRYLSQLSP